MVNLANKYTIYHFKTLTVLSAALTIFIGLTVLFGWIYDIPLLKSLNPSYISMKVNTALSFLFLGIAFLLMILTPDKPGIRIIPASLSMIVIIIALISLLEYILDRNVGIDEVLFRDIISDKTLFPGRWLLTQVPALFWLDHPSLFLALALKQKG